MSPKFAHHYDINPIALKMAKTLWSFGHFQYYRVNDVTKTANITF